jgi:acyl-CoA synthetase (NDP forming)
MSCSGGDAALVADAAAEREVDLPPLTAGQCERVQATLDDIVTVANPLDYHTFIWGQREALKATFRTMVDCAFDLLLLVLDFPRRDRCDDEADWNASAEALAAVVKDTGARTALVASMPDNLPEARACELIEQGIAPLSGLMEVMGAIKAAAFIGAAWRAAESPPPLTLAPHPQGNHRVLHEVAAKRRLADYGVAIPAGRIVADAHSAAQAAAQLDYPIAVKITGAAHKTEAGGVRLGLQDEQSVREAVRQLASSEQKLLVEHMVTDAVAELVVGVTFEPQFGLLLTIGAGGVLVEMLGDSVSLLLPATKAQLRAALDSLKIAPLLRGYRGRPAADIDAVIDAIAAVARFAEAQAGQLVELDINPLLVGPAGQGTTAADALIVIKEEKA